MWIKYPEYKECDGKDDGVHLMMLLVMMTYTCTLTELLLYARHCAKDFIKIIKSNSQNNSVRQISPFYRWENWEETKNGTMTSIQAALFFFFFFQAALFGYNVHHSFYSSCFCQWRNAFIKLYFLVWLIFTIISNYDSPLFFTPILIYTKMSSVTMGSFHIKYLFKY